MSDVGPKRIAILGIGLLGGSVARAIRRARPDVHVVGWSRRESTTAEALQLGVIQESAPTVEAACSQADVVVVAAPVDRISSLVMSALDATSQAAIVTDVGSTKRTIVEHVEAHPQASRFLAAHPIAGKEKSGVAFATEDLFDQRVVVLTPSETTSRETRERGKAFWELTRAKTLELDASTHDAYLAATSHVPHLVASAVAKLLPEAAVPLVGSGWCDTTRVAAGDPEMWEAICRENREAIRGELRRFAQTIQNLIEYLDREDDSGLLLWLAEAKAIREQV